MMKKLKRLLAVLALGVLTATTACTWNNVGTTNSSDTSEPESSVSVSSSAEEREAKLEVSAAEIFGKVREAIKLPTATATDKGGSSVADIRIKILFEEDEKFVLPTTGIAQGVALSDYPTWTPTKVGTYVITYFFIDLTGSQVAETVKLTVAENLDDQVGINLASPEQIAENWIAGDAATQNSVLNEYGEIVIAGAKNNNYSGAVYKGQKINNGDVVTFSFKAKPRNNIYFYNFSFMMQPNYAADEPAASDADWPMYYNMRVGDSIESFIVSANNNNFDLFPSIGINLLDNEEHILSVQITADTEKVTAKLWIDVDTTSAPNYTSTINRADVAARYGENSEHLKVFDESVCGWFGAGAYVLGDTSNDGLTLKGLTINNATSVRAPSIEVEDFGLMIVDEEYVLPTYTARDENDYADLTDAVKVEVKAPSAAQFVELTAGGYTPVEAGIYQFRYTVSDRRGNVEYKTVDVNCSKGASDVAPTITFAESVQETYEVALNEALEIPMPESVVDSFGDDISAHLNVSLVGREKASLNGVSSYVFRAAGENTIQYTVSDYNGNVSTYTVKVIVTDSAEGNLLENTGDWYLDKSSFTEDGCLSPNVTGATIAYGGQKIYDEKVSILMDLDLGTSGGSADGTNILLINLRGGKELTVGPKTENNPTGGTNLAWPSGVSLLFSTQYGLILKPNGYNSSDWAVATLNESLHDVFDGEKIVSFQFTDVLDENGEIKSVKFQMWVDDVKINWGGSFTNEDGDVLLNSRIIRYNAELTQAGWLSFYFNDVDTKDNEKTLIKSITIDGTKPYKLTVAADKEKDLSFAMGEEFVLPVVTAKKGEEDVSSQVKKFIWIGGEEEPDITGAGFDGLSVTPDLSYVKGFTVLYVLDGEIVKSIYVANGSSDATLTFAEGAAFTATLGQAFTLPEYEAKIDSLDVTQDVVVKIKIGYQETVVTDKTYTPKVNDFSVCYYLYDKLMAEKEVAVTGGATKENSVDGHTTGANAWAYTGEQIYNNKVQLTFSVAGGLPAGSKLHFGLRGNEQTTDAWFSFPKGLRIFIMNDSTWGTYMKIGAGNTNGWLEVDFGESKLKYNDIDWSKEQTMTYSVCDVYDENGVFSGIKVQVWLNGVNVAFATANGSKTDENGSYLLIPASYLATAPAEHYVPSYAFIWQSSNNKVNVSKAYIMETEDEAYPVVKYALDKESDQKFTVGSEYVLPVFSVTVDGVDKSSEVKKFIWIDGQEKPDTTGEGYTGASVTPDGSYGDLFTVIYVYNGEEVKTVSVANADKNQETEITFGENAYVATLKQAYEFPTFTATVGSTDVSEGVIVKVRLGYREYDVDGSYTPTAAEPFTLVYYYNGEVIAERNVSVTGGVEFDRNVASNGHTTGGKAWAYTDQQIYNNKVQLTFSLSGAFESGEFIDFGLRGNEQTTGAWFSNSKGLRVFLKYDPTWGVYFNVGTGNNNGWLVENFAESKNKYTNVDWTQAHTLTYAVGDVYENGEFAGVKVQLWLDGALVAFNTKNSATTDADGSYVLIPASYIATANADDFISSYLFVWHSGMKDITVSEAYIVEIK